MVNLLKYPAKFLYSVFEGMYLNPTAYRKTFEETNPPFTMPRINTEFFGRNIGALGMVVGTFGAMISYKNGAISQEQKDVLMYTLLATNVLDGAYEFIIRPRILGRKREKDNSETGLEKHL